MQCPQHGEVAIDILTKSEHGPNTFAGSLSCGCPIMAEPHAEEDNTVPCPQDGRVTVVRSISGPGGRRISFLSCGHIALSFPVSSQELFSVGN